MSRVLFGWGFLSGVFFSLALFFGLVFLHNAREKWHSFMCSQNLKHGGLLFADYQKEHGGKLPQRLDELDLARLEGTVHPLRCPKAWNRGTDAFLYLRPTHGAPPDTPFLFCWRHPKLWALTGSGQVKAWPK